MRNLKMPHLTNSKIAYKSLKLAEQAAPPNASGKDIYSAASRFANKVRKGAGHHTKMVPASIKLYNNLKNKNKHNVAKKILAAAANVKIRTN
jgi:hypothetical protein